MKIAVLSTSLKKNEQRRPIHPGSLSALPAAIRSRLFFEEGYGLPFGVSDDEIAAQTAGVKDRDRLLRESDVVILAKPVAKDAEAMRPGATLWGWVHCVQGTAITQAAIDRKLTCIAWEAMNYWNEDGSFRSHIFYANNQIAGYAAVLHAATLRGLDGRYGGKKRVVLINTGQVSTGALNGLRALGFADIAVVTPPSQPTLPPAFEGTEHYQLDASDLSSLKVTGIDGTTKPMIDLLSSADVIVNGIFQNPLKPYLFVQPGEERRLKKNALIVDVSCDAGMGFPFSRATSFDEPILRLHDLYYYAVDHTPSYLWDSATWQISEALLPWLGRIIAGPSEWEADPVINRAIEIRDGVILNRDILVFQKRADEYPHSVQD